MLNIILKFTKRFQKYSQIRNFCDKSILNNEYYVKERLSYKEIEHPLINKITKELYMKNKESIQNEENEKNIWINHPSCLKFNDNSINSIYKIVISDIINRKRIQEGYKINNIIQIETDSYDDIRQEIKKINDNLCALGILFDENMLKDIKNKENYMVLLKILRNLIERNIISIGNQSIIWDMNSKQKINIFDLEKIKEIVLSIFVKFEILNNDILIDNLNFLLESKLTIKETSDKNKRVELLHLKTTSNDLSKVINLIQSNSPKINLIGYLPEPWRYIGISGLEYNPSQLFGVFRIINIDQNEINNNNIDIDIDNEIFIACNKRIPEIIKKMNLKASKHIEYLFHFQAGEVFNNKLQLKENLFSRNLILLENQNVSEFYGSGINILVPGHDLSHEYLFQKNGISYKGHINDNGDISDLEIFTPKNISNEYIIKLLKRKKILLSEFDYQFETYINKENNKRVIVKTIPCLEIKINNNQKRSYLENFNSVITIPDGEFEDKGKKIYKNKLKENEIDGYKHMIEELDSIFNLIITKPNHKINGKYSNIGVYYNTAIPVYKKVIENRESIELDLELIDLFIEYISKLSVEKYVPTIDNIDLFGEYLLKNKKITESNKTIDFLYINDVLYEVSLWEILNKKVKEFFLEDEIVSKQLKEYMNKIKYLQERKSISSVNAFLNEVFDKNEEISKIQNKIFNLSKSIDDNSSTNKNSLNNINVTTNICLYQKHHHVDMFIRIGLFSFFSKRYIPYSIMKTIGHVLSKKGELSKINFLEIIKGVPTFNIFVDDNKNNDKNFGYGADTLRLLLAANDNDKDIVLLETDLSRAKQDIRSIRRMSRQLGLLYKLKEENEKYFKIYSNKEVLENIKSNDLLLRPIEIYNKELMVEYNNLPLIDQYILHKYIEFIEKIVSFQEKEKFKNLVDESLLFIQDYVNYYILISLKRLSLLSNSIDSSSKQRNIKEKNESLSSLYIKNIYTYTWINTQLIMTIISILSPIIPFNTQFIYESIISKKGICLEEIPPLSSLEKIYSLIPKYSKIIKSDNNLLFKFQVLSELQLKIRKFTIASAKQYKILLKDITIAIFIEKLSNEENFIITVEDDLKWFFNVSHVFISEDKSSIKKGGKYKILYNKEVKVNFDNVKLEYDIFILCDSSYDMKNIMKESLRSNQSDKFEKPFEQSNNSTIDKYFLEE